MCTVGYHKKLNLMFKNRDKNTTTNEVLLVRPEFTAIKTEGANYYSLGINKRSCGFVSTAVNNPLWTALASSGKDKDAAQQYKKDNDGLVNPIEIVSKYLPEVRNVDEWLDKVLNSGQKYIGYNLLLADKNMAVHVELHGEDSHVTPLGETAVISNHFQHLAYGPAKVDDYPNSYERFNAAQNFIGDLVSLEDLFEKLKPHENMGQNDFWRKGHFHTVSSSILDIDSNCTYYTQSSRQDYSRISNRIPPKGNEKTFIEMSRYIDLPTYHNIERGHPFYEEMLKEIDDQIIEYSKNSGHNNGKIKTLEIGAGTGLCSVELVKHGMLALDCLEIDKKCCEILENHSQASMYNVVLEDAVTYCKPHNYDLLISVFAHDHIHYDKRFAFARNIRNNLRKGGRYIMGGEILPYFSTDMERKKALFKYHNYIIETALQKNRVQLSELENNALKSGLDMIGDFKRHELMFEAEMESADFRLVHKNKIGPNDRDDVGGVYVYVFEA